MTQAIRHRLFPIVSLLVVFLIFRGLVEQPSYTDAFYHFNAAHRLARGDGLTDAYLWTYIGAPNSLPAPSHLYWMPMTSLAAALGMTMLNAPGNYTAAQLPFLVMLFLTTLVSYQLGYRLGGTARHAWMAGLLTLFSGYFTRFWVATDTFAPYALFGSLCLLALGEGATRAGRGALLAYAAAGALAGLAHLTRADGVLLLGVGWLVALWQLRRGGRLSSVFIAVVVMTAAYVLVMLPWFARNLALVGSPLPIGGAQGIWFTEYNDLFNYPPDASAAEFFAGGFRRLVATRWEAFVGNVQTFVAVEGMIVLTPLMLVGVWLRRRDAFLRGFWLYALGLHLAMTLIFPFPGYRGGLFHSAAALVPWWAALGVVGLDDAVAWLARRRRWRSGGARVVFSLALLTFAVFFSLWLGLAGRARAGVPALYRALEESLPLEARVMVNDPAQLYYYTGRGGVVLPNEAPDALPEIARRYGVDYLLLESPGGTPAPLLSLFETTPDFLRPVPLDVPGVRLYAFELDAN